MEKKTLEFKLNNINADTGVFEGIGNKTNFKDFADDIVVKGAFQKSISKRMPKLLWQHKADEPIGIFTEAFEDEDGYNAQQDNKILSAVNDTRLNMSQAFAEEKFGEETVGKAIEWFKTEGAKSAYTVNQFNAAKLPFHALVNMYNDDADRRDPAGFKARMKAEIMAELKEDAGETDTSETETETKKPITTSLASDRSTGATDKPEDWGDILN